MNPLPPWLAEPERLFAFLRERDLSIGTGEALRASALLDRLAQQGRAPQSSDAAARFLAPLLCTNAAEQAVLPPLLRDFAAAYEDESTDESNRHRESDRLPPPSDSLAGPLSLVSAQMVWIGVGIFVAVLILLAGLWLMPKLSTPIPPGPDQPVQPVGIGLSYLADLLQHLLVGLRYALLPWFASLLFRRFDQKRVPSLRRLQAPATTRPTTFQPQPGLPSLFGDADLRPWLQALRAHRQMPIDRLDVPRSVRATVAAGGRPVLLQATAPRLPDYPIMIEQLTGKDHLTALGRAITGRLANERVAFTAYYYSTDPRQLRDGARHPLALGDLAARHTEDMVLLVSDGDVLIDPLIGGVRAWVAEFAAWRNPVLLTPVPLQEWSAREQALMAAGFIVLPATPAGLQSLGEFLRRGEAGRPQMTAGRGAPGLLARAGRRTLAWHQDFPPDADEREALLNALAMSLPKAAFDLLCVLALFGEVRLDLTLSAGQKMRARDGKPLLNEASFTALAWLPWFRLGRIPDWLRLDLAQCLDARRLEQTHAFYKSWLTELESDDGSGEDLNLLSDRGLNRRLARDAASEGGRVVRDVLFLSFMRKEKLDALDLEAPQSLARLLRAGRPDPVWILGGVCGLVTVLAVLLARKLDSALWSAPSLDPFSSGELLETAYCMAAALVLVFWHLRALGAIRLKLFAWIFNPAFLAALLTCASWFVSTGWDLDVALVGLLATGSIMALALVSSVPKRPTLQHLVEWGRPRAGEVLAFAIMLATLYKPASATPLIWCSAVVALGSGALARFVSRGTGEPTLRLFLFGWFGACFGAALAVAVWSSLGLAFAFDPSDLGLASATTLVPIGIIYGIAIALWDSAHLRLGPMCGLTFAASCVATAAPVVTNVLGWPDAVLPVLPLYSLLAYFALTRSQVLWTSATYITCSAFVAVVAGIGFGIHAIGLDTLIRIPNLNVQYQLKWTSAGFGGTEFIQMLVIPLAAMLHRSLLSRSGWPLQWSAIFAVLRFFFGIIAAVVLLPFVLLSELWPERAGLRQRAETVVRRLLGGTPPLAAWRIAAPLFWLLAITPPPASGLVPGVTLCLTAWIATQFGAKARSAVIWGVLPFLATVPLGPISTYADSGLAIAALLIFRLYAEREFRRAALDARRIRFWPAAAAFLVLGMEVKLRLGAATLGGSALPALDLLVFIFAASRMRVWPLFPAVIIVGAIGFMLSLVPPVNVAGLTAGYALANLREVATALVFIAAGVMWRWTVARLQTPRPAKIAAPRSAAKTFGIRPAALPALVEIGQVIGIIAVAYITDVQFSYTIFGMTHTDSVIGAIALLPLSFLIGSQRGIGLAIIIVISMGFIAILLRIPTLAALGGALAVWLLGWRTSTSLSANQLRDADSASDVGTRIGVRAS